MARIFISYKRADKDNVFRIKERLESILDEKCWIDLTGIESDAQFKNVIISAINECEIVLFMYSKEHLTISDFEKDWTIRELNFAATKNKRIVFVNLDGSPLSDMFLFDYGTKQHVNGNSPEDMAKLANDLAKWLNLSEKKAEAETFIVSTKNSDRHSASYHIDPELCIACGTCQSECPSGAIKEGDNSYTIEQDSCVNCGICANECPIGAIEEKWQ